LNYWLTTHWPPRVGDDPNNVANGVWLPDGREKADAELKKGDIVFVYQSRSGRPEKRKTIDGPAPYAGRYGQSLVGNTG
jgi:hypothetical protein